MALFRLNSKVQNYPWGSTQALAQVLGRVPSGQPEAELWMGAHPLCPSPVVGDPQGATDLSALLRREPKLAPGGLPYLFKVLSAGAPLSLQAHPNAMQAEQGFARENAQGLSPDAKDRNYKDPRHKPELILALTNFSALCGFISYERILARLKHYRLDAGLPKYRVFAQQPEEHTLAELFASLFELPTEDCRTLVAAVSERARLDIEQRNGRAPLGRWLIELEHAYGADPGVIAATLLHYIELRPGEGLFLPPGVLHAYLGGTGLEIMAASDNVLRGGLTKKHVDVKELLATLDFRPYELALVPTKTVQVQPGALVTTFLTPAQEFQLSLVNITTGANYVAKGPDILLVLDGTVFVESEGRGQELRKGGQIFCSAGSDYVVTGSARFARASVQA